MNKDMTDKAIEEIRERLDRQQNGELKTLAPELYDYMATLLQALDAEKARVDRARDEGIEAAAKWHQQMADDVTRDKGPMQGTKQQKYKLRYHISCAKALRALKSTTQEQGENNETHNSRPDHA